MASGTWKSRMTGRTDGSTNQRCAKAFRKSLPTERRPQTAEAPMKLDRSHFGSCAGFSDACMTVLSTRAEALSRSWLAGIDLQR
jgi:hypothetical protein